MTYEDWLKLPITKKLIQALKEEATMTLRELADSKDPTKDPALKARAQLYLRLSDLDGLEMFIGINEGEDEKIYGVKR